MRSVKGYLKLVSMAAALLIPCVSQAAFESGSTGADGAFEPTVNTVLQIPESGVFNYSTVTIPSGVTVTFTKNSRNTPVTILASGNVTINGTVSVNGVSATVTAPGEGGPGGYGGAVGGFVTSSGFRGQGPGGGTGSTYGSCSYPAGAGGGSFASTGATGDNRCSLGGVGGSTYGNSTFQPLVGGSGGGGGTGFSSYRGGAGGGGAGAIMIASSGVITVNGAISANGGNGNGVSSPGGNNAGGGGGSGGAIRLIANVVNGEGSISATGGGCLNTSGTFLGGAGGTGRIRIEAWQINRVANTNPTYISYLYPAAVDPAAIPAISVTRIDDVNVPAIPAGIFKSPDVTLPYNATGPVTVTVTALNVPVGNTVTVKALPEIGNSVVTGTGVLAGTSDNSSVQIQLNTVKGMAYLLSASVNY